MSSEKKNRQRAETVLREKLARSQGPHPCLSGERLGAKGCWCIAKTKTPEASLLPAGVASEFGSNIYAKR